MTLGEAARATHTSKSTITRAIRSGRLSATRTDLGTYDIDPSELNRVYPIAPPTTVAATGGVERGATPDNTPATPIAHAIENVEVQILEVKIAGLKEMVVKLRAQLDDTQAERDQWSQQAERVVFLAGSRGLHFFQAALNAAIAFSRVGASPFGGLS
jgi:excisionase family DNA binding protein